MSTLSGDTLRLTLFGRSHGPSVGMTLSGLPAGEPVSLPALQDFLGRRAPGRSPLVTARREADIPRFLSGIKDGVTTGEDITAIIENTDVKSNDYPSLTTVPRPGHADYTAYVKYGRIEPGGGPFSGRLTAPLCVAGGLCLQMLRRRGITVLSRILSIGEVDDQGDLTAPTCEKAFPVVDDAQGEAMARAILQAKAQGDSLGGVIQCRVLGLPAGLGEPFFGSVESTLAALLFSIPAVKGVEFGLGFGFAGLTGSRANDAFRMQGTRVVTATNHNGGVNGGISNGMPLVLRTVVKPTPSIYKVQQTVDFAAKRNATLQISGRHDPCILHRARVVQDSLVAFGLADLCGQHFGTAWQEGAAWNMD